MSPHSRFIFIGDIHGCIDELVELLALVRPTAQDVVVGLGDFVDRGPRPDLCIELFAERGYRGVLGNHDERLLRWSAGDKVTHAEAFERTVDLVGREPYLDWLRALPLTLECPEVGLVAVHAALDLNWPNMRVPESEQQRDVLLRGRSVKRQGESWVYCPLDQTPADGSLWADLWDAEPTVIYAHTPTAGQPRLRKSAVGIDTGVAYGRRLTAAIVEGRGPLRFVSVSARRTYFSPPKKITVI